MDCQRFRPPCTLANLARGRCSMNATYQSARPWSERRLSEPRQEGSWGSRPGVQRDGNLKDRGRAVLGLPHPPPSAPSPSAHPDLEVSALGRVARSCPAGASPPSPPHAHPVVPGRAPGWVPWPGLAPPRPARLPSRGLMKPRRRAGVQGPPRPWGARARAPHPAARARSARAGGAWGSCRAARAWGSPRPAGPGVRPAAPPLGRPPLGAQARWPRGLAPRGAALRCWPGEGHSGAPRAGLAEASPRLKLNEPPRRLLTRGSCEHRAASRGEERAEGAALRGKPAARRPVRGREVLRSPEGPGVVVPPPPTVPVRFSEDAGEPPKRALTGVMFVSPSS